MAAFSWTIVNVWNSFLCKLYETRLCHVHPVGYVLQHSPGHKSHISVMPSLMSQSLWYSEKGEAWDRSVYKKASGSISPHTSNLENVVGEKKKHIVCYVAWCTVLQIIRKHNWNGSSDYYIRDKHSKFSYIFQDEIMI